MFMYIYMYLFVFDCFCFSPTWWPEVYDVSDLDNVQDIYVAYKVIYLRCKDSKEVDTSSSIVSALYRNQLTERRMYVIYVVCL